MHPFNEADGAVDTATADGQMVNHPDAPWYRQVDGRQWRAFFATFLGWLLDAFDFTIMTFILIDIQNSFTVDAALAGALGTVTLFFRLAGGLGAGTMADRRGRKLPLMLSILWFSLFACLSGFSTSYALLFVCRALFGIGMGGVWAAGMPLALEHWPTRLRGLASGLLQGGWFWGYMLSALIFSLIYPLFDTVPDPFSASPTSTLGWRVLFWIGGVPALLVLWIRTGVEESPVWLERQRYLKTRGREELADRVSLLRLLQPDLLWVTVQSSLLMSAFMFSYYAMSFWYPTFLRGIGVDPLRYVIGFNAGAIVGVALWGRASEGIIGRRGAIHAGCAARGGARAGLPGRVRPGAIVRGGGADGRHRRRHLGDGAGLSHRTVPDRGARRGTRIVLPRRRGGGVRHPVRAGTAAGRRHDHRRRDDVLHHRGRTAGGVRGLAGARDAGAAFQPYGRSGRAA